MKDKRVGMFVIVTLHPQIIYQMMHMCSDNSMLLEVFLIDNSLQGFIFAASFIEIKPIKLGALNYNTRSEERSSLPAFGRTLNGIIAGI